MELNGKGYMVAHIVLFITYYFHQADKIDINNFKRISSVQSLSRVRLFETLWIAACQASLSITNSRSLPKLMSIE